MGTFCWVDGWRCRVENALRILELATFCMEFPLLYAGDFKYFVNNCHRWHFLVAILLKFVNYVLGRGRQGALQAKKSGKIRPHNAKELP